MPTKWCALALCAAACGSVGGPPAVDSGVKVDAGAADAAIDAPPPRTYKGSLDQTAPVQFGGAPFCRYTITLKTLDVELGILPGGQVATGRVQNLNVEAVVVSTTPNCPATLPVIPPSIAMYTFQSAKPTMTGQQLTFRGLNTNNPRVDLVVDLSSVGTAFQARLGFHRVDQPAPLDWSVITTVSLSAQ